MRYCFVVVRESLGGYKTLVKAFRARWDAEEFLQSHPSSEIESYEIEDVETDFDIV